MILFATVTIYMLVRASAMCPSGCSCTTDQRHIVDCRNIQLREFPMLLDPRTKKLSLMNCGLRRIDFDVIELYPDLRFLDLSYNSIETLSATLFRMQKSLQVLRLNNNLLTTIQRGDLEGPTSLQELHLSNNRLISIEPYSLQDLSHLHTLRIDRNALRTIQFNSLNGLTSLRYLNASYNQIRSVQFDIFKFHHILQTVDLSNNQIRRVTFNNENSLKVLNLRSNKIGKLATSNLQTTMSLVRLDLANNSLDQTQMAALRSVNSLTEIDLSFNLFAEISTSLFEGLASLRHLTLANNHLLREIHLNAFSGLPKLQFLNLSYCPQLTALHEHAFEYVDRLRFFDLSNCALKSIPHDLLRWNSLVALNLSGNPLSCDCDQKLFLSQISTECSETNRFSLLLIAEKLYSCRNTSEHAVIISGLAMITMLALLIVFAIYLKKRWEGSDTPKKLAPIYQRSYKFNSTLHEKHRLLFNYEDFRMVIDESNKLAELDDDDGYCYLQTENSGLYEEAIRRCPPLPSPVTLPPIPTQISDSCNKTTQTFKIISHHPIPITEL